MDAVSHKPVMLEELIKYLDIEVSGLYVDCTGGNGGHAKRVLKGLGESGKFVVLDRDIDSYKRLYQLFHEDRRVRLINGRFSRLKRFLRTGVEGFANGLYADLGTSINFFKDAKRGFSFNTTSSLDMRMTTTDPLSASDVVNDFTEKQISDIIYKYGEERFSRRIAFNIVKRREKKRLKQPQN